MCAEARVYGSWSRFYGVKLLPEQQCAKALLRSEQ
jgi:hypothetical protein